MSDSGEKKSAEKEPSPVVSQQAPNPSFPFDVVVVADAAGRRDLSPEEFFALPLAERIQHVVQQRASFYSSGQRVDPKAALAQIRKLRTHLH